MLRNKEINNLQDLISKCYKKKNIVIPDNLVDILDSFKKIPVNIITVSENYADGIGDYISQLYFIKKLNTLFTNYENVFLKHFSFITSDKIKLAFTLKSEMYPQESVYILDDFSCSIEVISKNIESHSSIIIDIDKLRASKKSLTSYPYLKSIFSNCNFLFNIAICLEEIAWMKELLPLINNTAIINSWMEYGFHDNEQIRSLKIISEKSMGIREQDMGIRIDENIKQASNLDNNAKSNMLSALDNKILFNLISQDVNFVDYTNYLNTNSFVFGYIQDQNAARTFVRLAVHCNKKHGNLIAIVNTKFFIPNELDKDFIQHIKSSGFTDIKIEIDGKVEIIFLSEHDHEDNKKSLILINFAGTTAKDKICYLALAAMIAGSGDTSISEMITAAIGRSDNDLAPIPFIQAISHKKGFYKHIIREIKIFSKKENIDCKSLIDYMKSMINKFQTINNEDKFIHFCDNVKNNDLNIRYSWNQFSNYIYHHRNEDDYFIGMIIRLICHSFMRENFNDQCITLFSTLEHPYLNGDSLLHDAILLQNQQIIAKLTDEIYEDPFNIMHPHNGYKAIHMACVTGNPDILKQLVRSGADINAKNSLGETPLFIAWIYENDEIIKLLLDRHCDLTIKNAKEITITSFLISESKLILNHVNLFIQLLTQYKSHITKEEINGILCIAMQHEKVEILAALTNLNMMTVNENITINNRTDSLLFYSIRNNKKLVCNYLLSCPDLNINATNTSGETPIDFFINISDRIEPGDQAGWFKIANKIFSMQQTNILTNPMTFQDLKIKLIDECLHNYSNWVLSLFDVTTNQSNIQHVYYIFGLLSKTNDKETDQDKMNYLITKLTKYQKNNPEIKLINALVNHTQNMIDSIQHPTPSNNKSTGY